MSPRHRLASLVPLFAVVLLGACGGKTTGGTGGGEGGESSSGSSAPGGSGSGSSVGSATASGSGSCVDVTVPPSALTCESDSDCTIVATGQLCSTSCFCPLSPVNNASAAGIRAQYPVQTGGIACGCLIDGAPRCLSGVCTLCSGGPDDPSGCNDGGISTGDDSGIVIGVPDASTGTCVEIDLSDYSTTCNTASDCISINTGSVCDGSCACGGSLINVSGQAAYEQAIAGITFAGCPCAEQLPSCVNGECAFQQ